MVITHILTVQANFKITVRNLLIYSSSDPNDVWELKPETSFVKNDEDLTVVEPDQLIESFKYGSELIAVSGNSKFGGETQFSKF